MEYRTVESSHRRWTKERGHVTSKLPTRSADFKQDKQVQQIVGKVFGIPAYGPMTAAIRVFTDDFKTFFAHPHPAGGRAYLLPGPEPKMADAVLKQTLPVRDVDVQMPWLCPVSMSQAYAGALTYIHKVKSGLDIYFFANSSGAAIEATVVLRGHKNLALQPLTSVFYVQELL